MIANETEFEAALAYIARLQKLVLAMRRSEADLDNYRAASEGTLAEIDRVQFQVREYLAAHPAEAAA